MVIPEGPAADAIVKIASKMGVRGPARQVGHHRRRRLRTWGIEPAINVAGNAKAGVMAQARDGVTSTNGIAAVGA